MPSAELIEEEEPIQQTTAVIENDSLRRVAQGLHGGEACHADLVEACLRSSSDGFAENLDSDDREIEGRARRTLNHKIGEYVSVARKARSGCFSLIPESNPDLTTEAHEEQLVLARRLGKFRADAAKAGLRGALFAPDWGVSRPLARTAYSLDISSWKVLLSNFAQFAVSNGMINFEHRITKSQLVELAAANPIIYTLGFDYLRDDRGEFGQERTWHPKLHIDDIGSGSGAAVEALSTLDFEIPDIGPVPDIYSVTGHTLQMLEPIAKTFIGLLRPEYKNDKETKDLINFLTTTLLHKSYFDTEFKTQLENSSFTEIIELFKNPKNFVKWSHANKSYPTADENTFRPWDKNAVPPGIASRYRDWAPSTIDKFWSERLFENYKEIITEGRDGSASTYRTRVGDFLTTINPKSMDIAYTVRGISHVPEVEMPRYLFKIFNGLTNGGIYLGDDAHHDSILHNLGVYYHSDEIADSRGRLQGWVTQKNGQSMPGAIFVASKAPSGKFFDFRTSVAPTKGNATLSTRSVMNVAARLDVLVRRIVEGLMPIAQFKGSASNRNRMVPIVSKRLLANLKRRDLPSDMGLRDSVEAGRITQLLWASDERDLNKIEKALKGNRKAVAELILCAHKTYEKY